MPWMIGPNGLATNSSTIDAVLTIPCSTLLQLVSLLLWTCLNTTPKGQANQAFATVLSSQVIIEELLSSTSLVFAPGLFDTLQASTPPAVSYFKTLPTEFHKRWAVYLLVLENRIIAQGFTLVQVLMLEMVSLLVFADTTKVDF